MLLSDKKIYIHASTRRRVAIINLDHSRVQIRYIISGRSSFYSFQDFALRFTLLE
jgi:hypothetical protein